MKFSQLNNNNLISIASSDNINYFKILAIINFK